MEYNMEVPFIDHETYKVLKDTIDHLRERDGKAACLEIYLLDRIRIEEIVNRYEALNGRS